MLLESEPGALPGVGSFSLAGGARLPAAGIVRRLRTTDAGGAGHLRGAAPRPLPRHLVPPDDAPGDAAITTVGTST